MLADSTRYGGNQKGLSQDQGLDVDSQQDPWAALYSPIEHASPDHTMQALYNPTPQSAPYISQRDIHFRGSFAILHPTYGSPAASPSSRTGLQEVSPGTFDGNMWRMIPHVPYQSPRSGSDYTGPPLSFRSTGFDVHSQQYSQGNNAGAPNVISHLRPADLPQISSEFHLGPVRFDTRAVDDSSDLAEQTAAVHDPAERRTDYFYEIGDGSDVVRHGQLDQ